MIGSCFFFTNYLISYNFFKYLNMAMKLLFLFLHFHLSRDATLPQCFAREHKNF